jgi:hypothetical protein
MSLGPGLAARESIPRCARDRLAHFVRSAALPVDGWTVYLVAHLRVTRERRTCRLRLFGGQAGFGRTPRNKNNEEATQGGIEIKKDEGRDLDADTPLLGCVSVRPSSPTPWVA